MASGSFRTWPVLLSSFNSRFTRHAIFESCSMVTLVSATLIGECSFSPVRMPAIRLAKCASVMASRLSRPRLDPLSAALNESVIFPFRS